MTRWGGGLTLVLGVAPVAVVAVLGGARAARHPALVPLLVAGGYVLAVGLVVAAGFRADRAAMRYLQDHR